eukprot:7754-Heterococcus_DN1.PRE.1
MSNSSTSQYKLALLISALCMLGTALNQGAVTVVRKEKARSARVTHLHRVQAHVHVDKSTQVLSDLTRAHEPQQALYSYHRVILY